MLVFTCVSTSSSAAYAVCVGVCEWGVCPSRWVRGIIMYFYTVGTLWQGEIHTVVRTRQATKQLKLGYSWLLSWRMEIIIWPEKGMGRAWAFPDGVRSRRGHCWSMDTAAQSSLTSPSCHSQRQCFLATAGPWGRLTLLESWLAETA